MAKKRTQSANRKPIVEGGVMKGTVQWGIRTDRELRDWITNQASQMGISRDQFMRRILSGVREAAEEGNLEDSSLFQEMKSDLETEIRQALADAVSQFKIGTFSELNKAREKKKK